MRRVALIGLLLSVLLLGAVAASTYLPALPSMPSLSTLPSAGLVNRFLFKLFLDRGVLWRAAWTEVVQNHELLSPAGRPLTVYSPALASQDNQWTVHVHNSYLEMLRETGIVGGIVFLVLVARLWLRLARALLDRMPPLERVFAGAALITVLVGSTTGIFPFDFFAGPWVWSWAGIAVGLSLSSVPGDPRGAAQQPTGPYDPRAPGSQSDVVSADARL